MTCITILSLIKSDRKRLRSCWRKSEDSNGPDHEVRKFGDATGGSTSQMEGNTEEARPGAWTSPFEVRLQLPLLGRAPPGKGGPVVAVGFLHPKLTLLGFRLDALGFRLAFWA